MNQMINVQLCILFCDENIVYKAVNNRFALCSFGMIIRHRIRCSVWTSRIGGPLDTSFPIPGIRRNPTVSLSKPSGDCHSDGFSVLAQWPKQLNITIDRDYQILSGPVAIALANEATKCCSIPSGALSTCKGYCHSCSRTSTSILLR